MADNKIYWSGLEELDRTPEYESESHRRSFPLSVPSMTSSPTIGFRGPTPGAGTS